MFEVVPETSEIGLKLLELIDARRADPDFLHSFDWLLWGLLNRVRSHILELPDNPEDSETQKAERRLIRELNEHCRRYILALGEP